MYLAIAFVVSLCFYPQNEVHDPGHTMMLRSKARRRSVISGRPAKQETVMGSANNTLVVKRCQYLPGLLCIDYAKHAIIMEYVNPYSRDLSDADVQDIGKFLNQLYRANYVHRDLSLRHLKTRQNRMVFIDYGFAARTTETTCFQGSSHTAPQPVLEKLSEMQKLNTDPNKPLVYQYQPKCEHDLESVLKMLYLQAKRYFRERVMAIGPCNFTELCSVWEGVDQKPVWRECFACARNNDVNGMLGNISPSLLT